MLWLLVIFLLVLWALGYFAFNLGALLHILLVIALIVAIYNLVVYKRL